MYIENYHVVGLTGNDSIAIVLDERWVNRSAYQERIGVPRHDFAGDESIRYKHDEMAVHLTQKAVDYIERHEKEPFFLYFDHRNVHGPIIPHKKRGDELSRFPSDRNQWSLY